DLRERWRRSGGPSSRRATEDPTVAPFAGLPIGGDSWNGRAIPVRGRPIRRPRRPAARPALSDPLELPGPAQPVRDVRRGDDPHELAVPGDQYPPRAGLLHPL